MDANRALVFALSNLSSIPTVFRTVSYDAGLTWSSAVNTGIVVIGVSGSPFLSAVQNGAGVAMTAVEPLISALFPPSCYLYLSGDQGLTWTGELGYSMSMWGSVGAVPVRDGFLGLSSNSPPNGLSVHVQLLTGFQPYGPATTGSSAIPPRLERAGMPVLGGTVTLDLLDTVGGSPAVFGFSFAGPDQRAFGPATLLVANPVFPIWTSTSGSPGVPGVGSAQLAVTIPNTAAFHRMRVNLQGFVLDSGAAAGFSATSGLEMWVQ
jgi:hypothetical protein